MHYCAKKEKYVLLVLHLQFQAYYSITHWGHKTLENKAVYTSRSRVRVGRGSDEIDQLDSLAGAVTPKPPINAEKSKVLRTDRPTDSRQSGS